MLASPRFVDRKQNFPQNYGSKTVNKILSSYYYFFCKIKSYHYMILVTNKINFMECYIADRP